MKKKGLPFILILRTLFVALFVDIRSVNWALVYGGFVSEGTMNVIYPMVIGAIILTVLLQPNKIASKKNTYAFFVLLYILAFYYFTIFFLGTPRISFVMFLALSVFAFTIPLICRIDAKILIKGIMFYPFFAVTRMDRVFPMVTEWQNFMDMDASYSFLVPVTANVVYLFFFFKEEKVVGRIVTVLLSICNLLFSFKILIHGSRGVVLSLFLLFLFLFIVQINKSNKGVEVHKGRLRSASVALLIIATSYISFFTFLYKYLERVFGVTFYAIEKVARMGAEGDLDNGRNAIGKVAIEGFFDQPIFGHGIDRFTDVTGMNYPHNFVLQLLFDGGLVLFFILLVPFVLSIYRFLKQCKREEFVVFCTLFFASVPGAFFSQDLWNMPVLWMTFGFCLSHGFVISKVDFNK